MAEVAWDDTLSVGIDLIDDQHKALIGRLNDVSRAVAIHQGGNEVIRTLGFLIDYTNYHFTAEESHMAAQNYPQRERHKAKHAEFVTTLADLKRDFEEEGATTELAEAIHTLLWNWLVEHIKGTDAAFGQFLEDRNVTLGS